jgi:ZIP family zinc transporter
LSFAQTVLLGAIAGVTIYLGLPVGLIRTQNIRLKTFLSGISAGVLTFLAVEIFGHAFEGVEETLERAREAETTWGSFTLMAVVFTFGIAAGLLSLFYLMRALRPQLPKAIDPDDVSVVESEQLHVRRREAFHLSMSIAAAIGLHNFSEGLAIGQSARAGQTTLALLLVVGFALHNSTEGFGIVGPLAAADARASWRWIGIAGLVGGGPTFIGTIVGTSFQNDFVYTAFLALAGGAIVYVLAELFAAGRKMDWEMTLWGTLSGFLAGAGAELVLVLGGG